MAKDATGAFPLTESGSGSFSSLFCDSSCSLRGGARYCDHFEARDSETIFRRTGTIEYGKRSSTTAVAIPNFSSKKIAWNWAAEPTKKTARFKQDDCDDARYGPNDQTIFFTYKICIDKQLRSMRRWQPRYPRDRAP
jgi:hypothetical protein